MVAGQSMSDAGLDASLVLANVALPDLRILVCRMEVRAAPLVPAPLALGEIPAWIPTYLPLGLTLCRTGAGFGATKDGQVVVAWIRLSLSAAQPLVLGWPNESDERPVITVLNKRGNRVVRISGDAGGFTYAVLRTGSRALWLIWGTLTWRDLLKVLLSLPSDDL